MHCVLHIKPHLSRSGIPRGSKSNVAGRFATRIVDRVYRSNDRRSIAEAARPTPGTSSEFWPLDLAEFNGSDGYGWGATTTTLWIRQIFGFLDDYSSKEYAFILTPNLPTEWLVAGRHFGFSGLPYRGNRLDIRYEVSGSATLEAVVRAETGWVASVIALNGSAMDLTSPPRSTTAKFAIALNRSVRVVLSEESDPPSSGR